MTRADLFPIWAGGKAGYLYNVTLDGDLVLERSRDPACDLARVLLARGVKGKAILYDGKTGQPRLIVNIERAAKVTAVDEPRLRFVTWKPFQKGEQSGSVTPHSPERAEMRAKG